LSNARNSKTLNLNTEEAGTIGLQEAENLLRDLGDDVNLSVRDRLVPLVSILQTEADEEEQRAALAVEQLRDVAARDRRTRLCAGQLDKMEQQTDFARTEYLSPMSLRATLLNSCHFKTAIKHSPEYDEVEQIDGCVRVSANLVSPINSTSTLLTRNPKSSCWLSRKESSFHW